MVGSMVAVWPFAPASWSRLTSRTPPAALYRKIALLGGRAQDDALALHVRGLPHCLVVHEEERLVAAVEEMGDADGAAEAHPVVVELRAWPRGALPVAGSGGRSRLLNQVFGVEGVAPEVLVEAAVVVVACPGG